MDKEQTAIARLREASEQSLSFYEKPLLLTMSGGKDSSVLIQLAINAGIPFEIQHNHTTADAPETVYFVRDEAKRLEGLGRDVNIAYPHYKGTRTSMWQLIPQAGMPPTRHRRYCCGVLKEQAGEQNRYIATGVRWAESQKRKSRGIYETAAAKKENRIILMNDNDDTRRLFEHCTLKSKHVVNPIVDWTDDDVWDYLHEQGVPTNPLYLEGWDRVGCIGCPLASTKKRMRDFARYPRYKAMYISAFDRMLKRLIEQGKTKRAHETAIDAFHRWMEDGVLAGQITMEDLEDE